MTIRHYFALSALAAAMALLPGCTTAPKSNGTPSVDTAGSNEPDLMDKLRERMAQGPVKRQEKAETPAPVAATDSSKSPTVAVDLAKQQAAGSIAPDYAKAIGLMAAGKDDEALPLLQKLAEQSPNFSGPVVNQGVILLRQKKYAEAEKLFQKGVEINPKSPYAFNMLGLSLRELGKFADAKAAYETALTLDPNYAKAHFNLAVLADLYMQDLPLALAHYQRYQGLQSKSDVAVGNWIVDLQKRTGTYKPVAKPAPAPTDAPADAAPAQDATTTQTASNAPANESGGAGGGAPAQPAPEASPAPQAAPAEAAPQPAPEAAPATKAKKPAAKAKRGKS